MSPSRESDDLKELRALAVDVDPPREVEERVVAELRRRGLVGAERAASPPGWRPRLAVAAGLLLAALGGWVARGVVEATPVPGGPGGSPSGSQGGSEYMLILTEPEGLETSKSTPELVAEYRRWAGGLIEQDRLVTSRRLERGARDLEAGNAEPVQVSPTPLAEEATGFFLVRADSLDEAVSLASGCPHLTYGGRITVSEVARRAG